MKLTPAQRHAKDRLRTARQAQKNARSTFEAEMEIAWLQRSARVNEAFDQAVRDAVHLGVPMSQMQEAYGSKDYNTMKRIIERVTTQHEHVVESMVHVEAIADDRFTVTLTNFDDWTDPDNGTEPLSGTATYQRDSEGEWIPEDYTDVARAVERELWINTPLRQEVAKHVGLDTLPLAEDDGDYGLDDGDASGFVYVGPEI